MIIDEVKINISAGDGGSGTAAFSKTRFNLGPTGGNGGKGGDVFLEGVTDLMALRNFQSRKDFKAENGENGKPSLRDGHNGKDLILQVPVGTVCSNLTTGIEIEITSPKQRELIAKGGIGGRGNYVFRSSLNTSPRQFEQGKPGQSFQMKLELKMIADVGFIGLPNAGKSSLLNELTNAKSKVANYPFTTLEPNLGVYYGLILADIPGLIEGASLGKGLGTKFLRHIERTKVLFHLISAESENPVLDYKKVRKELESYSKKLLEKKEYILLSKSDLLDKNAISNVKKEFKSIKKTVTPVSIIDPKTMKAVAKILNGVV